MRYICPLLVVEDLKRSRKLYEGVLGQSIKADYGENITFNGDFALHEKEHFSGLIAREISLTKHNSMELYFEDDDVASIAQTIKGMGLEIIHDLQEQPWRQQVFRFYDYDKHIIEIGESLEHLAFRLHREGQTIEQICKTTYLAKEEVLQAIKQYSTK